MKLRLLLTAAGLVLFSAVRALALTIPSDGSDGVFAPTSNIVVDLGLAPTGAWDANNTAAAGKGRYDPIKWAVVFKYSSVNIPAGVTVTFKNHPTYAPVVWLVSGNVVIGGTVSVAGQNGADDDVSRLTPGEPGPGGFRGGAAGPTGFGNGYGPGAGLAAYGSVYGNPQIIPLIGGSGADSGDWGDPKAGAGGGAILIAATGSVSIQGLIDANGGFGGGWRAGKSGSGGAVRVIAATISGGGRVRALNPAESAGYGRIRIESPNLASTLQISPETIAVAPAATPIIWPADNAPTIRIHSVDGVPAPLDPTAALVSSADVGIQKNGTVQVVLQATNFPVSGNVQLRTVQKYGPSSWATATVQAGGTFAASSWTVNVAFAPGFTTLQARATVP